MCATGHDGSEGRRQAAQAMKLVHAFGAQLLEMTSQLAWIERQDVSGRNRRACAMRLEATALRHDINEAQMFIDRLQRRYLNPNKHNEQR